MTATLLKSAVSICTYLYFCLNKHPVVRSLTKISTIDCFHYIIMNVIKKSRS